jgi:hypothetical protein
VLIEATAPVRAALPVRTALLRAEPMARPVIDRLDPPTVTDGGTVSIKGGNLKGTTTKVRVGGILREPPPEDVDDSQLTVVLPGGLRAGVNPVQVVHEIELGEPPAPHPGAGFESNVAAIVLAPLVTSAPPISVAAGATLTLAIAPAVAREQRVAVLIGERRITVPPRAPTDPPTATTIAVDIPADFGAGTFLLRVQVDGAISPLQVDDDPASPTYHQYVGPTIEVT